MVSGVVIAISMFGGALGARISVAWQRAFGLVGLLAVGMLIQLAIVGVMAAFVHAAVLVLVFTRNFPMSLVHAPVNAAIAPRISTEQRATYLSMQGLSDRVVFALLLLWLSSGLEPGQPVEADVLGSILSRSALIGGLGAIALFVFAAAIIKRLQRKNG